MFYGVLFCNGGEVISMPYTYLNGGTEISFSPIHIHICIYRERATGIQTDRKGHGTQGERKQINQKGKDTPLILIRESHARYWLKQKAPSMPGSTPSIKHLE